MLWFFRDLFSERCINGIVGISFLPSAVVNRNFAVPCETPFVCSLPENVLFLTENLI